VATFWLQFGKASIAAVFAEGITVSYVYSLFYLIAYLKDDSAPGTRGVWLCCAYSAAIFVSTIFRNYYIFQGYVVAI
jgi:hypothetical protein